MLGETMQRASKTSDVAYAALMDSAPNHKSRMAIASRMLKRATDLRGKQVYDFGCGEGTFSRMLEAEGAFVSGCDPSRELSARADAVCGGVETLTGVADSSVDILVVLNVLSYFQEPTDFQIFWNEAARITRHGGLMIQCNPNRWAAHAGRYAFITDPDEFPQILTRHGFEEIQSDFYRYYPILFGRGERIHDPERLKIIPQTLLSRRSTGYFSLSRRITP